MRKLVFVALLFISATASAMETNRINRSSFTQTNDTTKCIAGAQFLDSIVIGAASAGGSLTVYNSTWTNTPVISSVSLGTVQTQYLNNLAVSGICYTTVSNTNGVMLIYKK